MHPINIVCVNAGNYCGRGKEYVTKLFDMIRRNTSESFNFYCFTDDPEDYPEVITKKSFPKNLKGWYAKLYLFSEEAGLEGQTFFFDLDTLITMNIDELLGYRGKFAILRDFYRPEGYGSGVMSWQKGFGREIWEQFESSGLPEVEGGDQAFIESCVKDADRLQDLFGGIYSFKEHCEKWPPADARVICFHGRPRPHELKNSWVELIWAIGGARQVEEDRSMMNTPQEQVAKNMEANVKLDLPWMIAKPARSNNKTVCIVGGAPSLKDNLGKLREKIKLGALVYSVNGATKFLADRGIISDVHIQFDARPDCASFLDGVHKDTYCFIGSMSDPSTFERAKELGLKTIVWHGGFDWDEMMRILDPYQYKPIVVIGGGTTVALRALNIGYMLGHHKFVMFGVDSSFSQREHHAYAQPLNDKDSYFDVHANGNVYQCAPWMYRQAMNFQEMYRQLAGLGCKIQVYGTGLIPDICRYLNKGE